MSKEKQITEVYELLFHSPLEAGEENNQFIIVSGATAQSG